MQRMSNGDYFDEKMRRGDRSKEARRISPPLKLLLKSPELRGSTAPKSAHLHRGREQGGAYIRFEVGGYCPLLLLTFMSTKSLGEVGSIFSVLDNVT